MNLFSKTLLLSCIITSGLHCGFYEESLMEKQGMQLEITALLEVLKRCDQRDIYSDKTKSDALTSGEIAYDVYYNELVACAIAQDNFLKIMEKMRRNYADIIPMTQQTSSK
jgi:hypothetical protein